MGASSQRKGRRAELELVGILRDQYGCENVRAGRAISYGEEPDIVGLDGIHIESKRCEQLRLSEWMEQAEKDAARFQDGRPVIFHRKNRAPWCCTMTLETFMQLYAAANR